MARKVLVVGRAGYVGSVLCRELLDRGYAVRVLDRLYFGEDGIKEIRDRIEPMVGNMRTVSREVFDDIMGVINVGGLSNDPTAEYNPKANWQIKMVATVKLAQMCKEKGVRKYVFASTA